MSSLRFSRTIALRYLWSKRSEAFITIITVISVLGVAIGVVVLNMTMAIMSGFEVELRNKIVGSAHIQVVGAGGIIRRWQETSEVIRGVDEVVSVSAFTHNNALLTVGRHARGLIIRGITADSPAARELAGYVEGGASVNALFEEQQIEVPTEGGGSETAMLPGLMVGRELARVADLFPGEPVSLLSPQVTSSPFGLVPRYRRFMIVGIYKSGMVGYEEALAYTSLESAQKFFRMGDSVTGIEVMVKNAANAPLIAQRIQEELTRRMGGGFYVEDWTVRNKPLWDALALEKQAYFIVLLLLIVLASFTIISALIMIVIEKRRDIAIMRTMGATATSIANIFRIQGAVIGALGTILGSLGGYAGAVALREYGFRLPENVFPTSTVPVYLDWVNFLMVGAAAFLICCVSTLYPARRASRLSPSEVLRYE